MEKEQMKNALLVKVNSGLHEKLMQAALQQKQQKPEIKPLIPKKVLLVFALLWAFLLTFPLLWMALPETHGISTPYWVKLFNNMTYIQRELRYYLPFLLVLGSLWFCYQLFYLNKDSVTQKIKL